MRYRVTHRFTLLHKTMVVVSRLPGSTTGYDIPSPTWVPLQKHHHNRWLPYIRYWDPNPIVISLISYVEATPQILSTWYSLYSHHHNWWLSCVTYRDPTTTVIRLLLHVQATPQILSTWYSLYSQHHNGWLPCITYRYPTKNAMRYRVTHRFTLLHKTMVVVSRLPGSTTEYDIPSHTWVPLQKHHHNRWLPYIRYWDPNPIVISLISYVEATPQIISTWYRLYSHHHNWWLPCITYRDPTTTVIRLLLHVQATPQILSTWYSLYSHHHNRWLPCITYRDPTTNAMRYRVTHRFTLLHKTKVVVSRLPGCTTEFDIPSHTCVPLQNHQQNIWLPYIKCWNPATVIISLIP